MEKRVLKNLAGIWSLNRDISGIGRYAGTAQFVLIEENNILYRENVDLNVGKSTHRIEGYKEYKYIYDNRGITKYFVEKNVPDRIFYRLSFADNFSLGYGYHICGQDHYNALYEFHSADSLKIIYEVKGPQKDYTISSVYKRIGS